MRVIQAYVKAHDFLPEHALLRLDGQYGTGAVVSDLAGFSYVTRGKDYRLLDRAEVQARLHLPADQHLTQPESGICRALYDCPDQPPSAKQASGFASSSRPILLELPKVGSVSPAPGSSMNSF